MINYFIRCSEQDKDTLTENGFMFSDYQMDTGEGILIQEHLLTQFLELTTKTKLAENTTTTYGINEIIVESAFLPKLVKLFLPNSGRHVRDDYNELSKLTGSSIISTRIERSANPRDVHYLKQNISNEYDISDVVGRMILITHRFRPDTEGMATSVIPTGLEGNQQARDYLSNGSCPGIDESADFHIVDDYTRFVEANGYIIDDVIHISICPDLLRNNNDMETTVHIAILNRIRATFTNGWKTLAPKCTVGTPGWTGSRSTAYKDVISEEVLPYVSSNIIFYKDASSNTLMNGSDLVIYSGQNFSENGCNKRVTGPETIFGEDSSTWLGSSTKIRAYYGMGLPIADPETGFIFGEYLGNTLYMFVNINGSGNKGELDFLRNFLRRFVEVMLLSGDDRIELMKKAREVNAPSDEELDKAVTLSMNRVLGDIEDRQRTSDDKVREMEAKYLSAIQEQEAIKAVMSIMQQPAELRRGKIIKELAMINDQNKVDISYISGTFLIVLTHSLAAEDDRTGKMHDIGRFMISVPMTELSNSDRRTMFGIRFTNMTRKVDAYENKMNAPHVYAAGHACLGSIQTALPQLAGQSEFATLITLCIEFLSSANTEDPAGRHINDWPLVESVEAKDANFLKPVIIEESNDSTEPDSETGDESGDDAIVITEET